MIHCIKFAQISLKKINIDHFLLSLKLIWLIEILVLVNDLGLYLLYYFFMLRDWVRRPIFPVLQLRINIFISLHPRVNGSFITMPKYFSSMSLRSYIILGFLFVFFQRWVLGNSGSSILIKIFVLSASGDFRGLV